MQQDNDKAGAFARGWIADNINPGPFSIGDGPVGQAMVDQFVAEAKRAGVPHDELECSLGSIRLFLQGAFDAAASAWKADLRSSVS